jgi:PPM family protein phosphatase
MSDPGINNIRLRSSARTSVGQVRENNEDNIRLWTGDSFALAVVADGMGGAAAGEEASRIAVEAIQIGLAEREYPRQNTSDKSSDDMLNEKMRAVIRQANLSIMQRAAKEPEMRGMGTTVTLALVRGTDVLVAHVGDSRAYLVSGFDSEITQITSDHSFVEALVAAGHITREQAEEHPMKNVLYRALGQTEDVDVDLFHTHMQVGDRLVLCSDGLTRHVKPHEIARLALEDENPELSSQKLIDLANARGGEDNVSVIIIAVERDNANRTSKINIAHEPQEDDEDTLVLKARPTIANKLHDDDKHPKSALELIVDESDSPQKQKMSGERLSDDFNTSSGEPKNSDDTTLPDLSNLDRTLDVRPYIKQPVLDGQQRRESDGEGHDTLTPDQ